MIYTWMSHVLVLVLTPPLLLLPPTLGQDILREAGCSFQGYDGIIYNIGFSREVIQKPCPIETLNNQFKDSDRRVQELTYEVSHLQGLMLRVLEVNGTVTQRLAQLEAELRATKEALRMSQAAATDCPPLYDVRNDEARSCYMFVGRDLSWYEAEAFCMSTGGHLVALETEEEQTFVVNYIRSTRVLPGNHMWTGGNDIAKEGNWIWAGINVPFNFTKWLTYPHEVDGTVQMPDNHQDIEHCVHLFHLHNYEWNDIYCGLKYHFACEYKLIG
nr:C-type lectin domain-containing type 2 protein 1 [Arenicola marina]